ncbi:hypothetical protein [Streptomyces catenulae]|uniref:Uncharacterized protein n=1 Tax=Streptomyces catenulae TaxID=66875 RepID=A0ABV2Z3X3_9ACTN|nr:hypothetical protein [Streptomyces catenulae]
MNRALRLTAVSVITASLLLGGGAAAFAAPTQPHTPAPVAATAPAPASLTAKASVSAVGAWEEFRITGTSHGIPAGTRVTVQQKQGTRWVSLPAQTPVNSTGAYSVRVKLGIKGLNHLRMAVNTTVSPEFTVTVR